MFRSDPKKSVSVSCQCQCRLPAERVVARTRARARVVLVVPFRTRGRGRGRVGNRGAVYQDEEAKSGESEWREIRHHHRLIWKASLNDANRTQAGSLCPEGGYRTQPRVSTLGALKINGSP